MDEQERDELGRFAGDGGGSGGLKEWADRKVTGSKFMSAKPTTVGKLKAGDRVVTEDGKEKEVKAVYKARAAGYMVVHYKDGTTGGGHKRTPLRIK